MSELPKPVVEFLQTEIARLQSPAFLLVDGESRVLDWGGPIETYGIDGLERGKSAVSQVPFLEGLLPITRPEHLLRVTTAGGTTADVDAFTAPEGTWVVLRNATWVTQHEQELQQSRNALRLLQEQLARGGTSAATSDYTAAAGVLGALGIAVLEPTDAGEFRLLGAPPLWLLALWPHAVAAAEGFAPQLDSPFLADFLVDAREAWAIGTERRSGPWTELDGSGGERQLEATARTIGGRKLLTIADVGAGLEEQRGLLQRAREQALSHEQILKEIEKKDVLLHSIVHDLRTPMISAHAALQLLATEDLPPHARRTLSVGQTELERQDLLIRSILDVFASDLQTLEEHSTLAPPVGVLDCVREVMDAAGPTAALRDVGLDLSVAAGAEPSPVVADRSRLVRVVANLLDNALRHSKAGTMVTVAVETDGEVVLVGVEDQGPGVPKELVPRLFDRFARGGESGGTGLGLHFCRITIESWGGTIGYERRRPAGSRFWFRLPLAATV